MRAAAAYLLDILACSIHPTGIHQPAILLWDLSAYPDELDKRVINPRSVRKPEATPGTKFIEKEQFLLLGA